MHPKSGRTVRALAFVAVGAAALVLVYHVYARHLELPNRIPEAAPYNTAESQVYPPPYDASWNGTNNPGKCSGCHTLLFDQWNGSMMANSWRDPGWRAAFLLIARLTATDGNCDVPNPPDGTTRALINPFANGDCTSTFDLGTQLHTTSGSGSLLDEFCSACHMPANYIDNVTSVITDTPSGLEHGEVDPNYDPTSSNGTNLAYATLSSQYRNTEPGKRGIFCKMCHSMVESRYTPFHNYNRTGTEYVPAVGTQSRDNLVAAGDVDLLNVADATSPNLGYGVGARAYRISPHAINRPERFGPLTFGDHTATLDSYVSDVFGINFFYQQGDFSRHDGFYTAFMERAEWCAACHDVTNPITIKNDLGNWVGGFPIERTYTEWRNSAYADRPQNPNFDPAYKRDCQTCHMQQDYGRPGTAQTLYAGGQPVAPIDGHACDTGPLRPVLYTHHFIGGNTYVTRLIGADVSSNGAVQPYPELSTFSFSSDDSASIYHNAVWENVTNTGLRTQHARLAWERLRNVLDLSVTGPASAGAGTTVGINVSAANAGSGHNFPSGFPEGRNAWLAVRAWDTATGAELEIQDSFWGRTSYGVGYLLQADGADPSFPGCNWTVPAGGPDPYAFQFRAVASKGDGCPTLDLPYATPLNLVTNAQGLPIDSGGTVIDRNNPLGLPQFTDEDGDGEVFDDSFLLDTRLGPRGTVNNSRNFTRYSVVIPPGTAGPVAVTAAVYYQSFEAVVAKKFLGNLADLNGNFVLEPCVLGGLCDGSTPSVEPAVVEGAPPVPMEVASWTIEIAPDATAPSEVFTYPANGAVNVYDDVVPKIGFCEPVTGIDDTTFTLTDSGGLQVPASVAQISDGVWALFPDQVWLATRETYTARVAAPICDAAGNCIAQDIVWSFDTTTTAGQGSGDTAAPLGFGAGCGGGGGDPAPFVTAIDPPDGAANVLRNANVVVTFSEPVTGFAGPGGFTLNEAGGNGKNCNQLGALVPGVSTPNGTGDVWTFNPDNTLLARVLYCVNIGTGVVDSALQPLDPTFSSQFKTGNN